MKLRRIDLLKRNDYLTKAIYLFYTFGFKQKDVAYLLGIPKKTLQERFPKKPKSPSKERSRK